MCLCGVVLWGIFCRLKQCWNLFNLFVKERETWMVQNSPLLGRYLWQLCQGFLRKLQFWPLPIHYVSYLLCVLWHTRPSFIFTYWFIYSFIYSYFLYNTVGSAGDGYSKNPWLKNLGFKNLLGPLYTRTCLA